MPVRLGPFELKEKFAAGGMGEIWRGMHVEQKVPVAIKVITGPNALVDEYMEEFRREVQAVARLNHPNVVQVLDYGKLPQEVEQLDGLLPGAPYLVMEYASRGSLADQVSVLNWRDLKNILMSTLGGLAHAHARGVVHRDIKPGNVLLGSHHESPPRIILTDFGVAHATDRVTRTDAVDLTARSTEEASGTPRYMSPEQFMGRWRDYGPATDLYAMGIMAYHLASGELPFQGTTFMLLAMAHINQPIPPLKAQIDVPEGFEEWIQRLTQKDPRDRYQSAANAAWALTQLDDSDLLYGELSNIAGDTGDDDDEWDDTDMLPTRIDFALPEAVRVFEMSRSVSDKGYEDVPPLPASWVEAEPPRAQVSLVGSGLGLFGLRSIPLVGREDERTKLWDVFKRVHGKRESHAVIIKGFGGTGKSGLVQWFHNLVEEIGAATTFRASHSETPGLMHGLGWMLNSHFRVAGLPPDELEARLTDVLGRHDIADQATLLGLVEIMRTEKRESSGSTSMFVRFTHAEQRYQVVRDVIDGVEPERPVVIWLDDAHWESDSLKFTDWLLDEPGRDDHPKMIVLTMQSEALDEREGVAAALERLEQRENTTVIDLAPLGTDLTTQLVREHLYLPLELAQDVARQAAGSPLFAIQLVEDWVKRGVLEVEGGSFVVRRGERVSLPTDVSELWENRFGFLIAELISNEDETLTEKRARSALEIAATLGQDFDLEEWTAACAVARIPEAQVRVIVEALVRQRLATREENAVSFINAKLVERLRDFAKEAGRWVSHNMVCARMLMTLYGGEHPGLAQRVGRHYVEAKAHELAVTCLEEAYQRAHGTAEQREINEINDLLGRCFESMGVPEDDIRWAELFVRRAVPRIYSPDPTVFDEGVELLEKAERVARGKGDELPSGKRRLVLAGILRAQAWASIHGQIIARGINKAEEALSLSSGHGSLEASCHRTLGHLLLVDGQLDRAEEHLRKAIELAPRSVHAVWARQQLASTFIIRGKLDQAEHLLQIAGEVADKYSIRMLQAQIHETSAFVAERRGDFVLAEERHREALNLRAAISVDSTLYAKSREYVARAILAQERYDEAFELLEPLVEKLNSGAKGFFTHLDDALLACAAARGDWDAWEELVNPALTFDQFPPSAVHGRALLAAARLARRAGRLDAAMKVYARGARLLRDHDVELDTAQLMQNEAAEVAGAPAARSQPTSVPLDDSSSRFPATDTGTHPTPEAVTTDDELAEESDPMDEPDFTGRVQVLSMPVDPPQEFSAMALGEQSEVDEAWSDFDDAKGELISGAVSTIAEEAPQRQSLREQRTTPPPQPTEQWAMPSRDELARLGFKGVSGDDGDGDLPTSLRKHTPHKSGDGDG